MQEICSMEILILCHWRHSTLSKEEPQRGFLGNIKLIIEPSSTEKGSIWIAMLNWHSDFPVQRPPQRKPTSIMYRHLLINHLTALAHFLTNVQPTAWLKQPPSINSLDWFALFPLFILTSSYSINPRALWHILSVKKYLISTYMAH